MPSILQNALLDLKPLGLSILAGVLAIVVVTLTPYFFLSSRPSNYPPGPATIPVVGNLHKIPPSKSFILFQEWGEEYGPILGLKFGPVNVVILNQWKDVQTLLDARSSKYSSRPVNYICQELICPNDVHVLFSPSRAGWKSSRKAMAPLLNSKGTSDLLPLQSAEATRTIVSILKDPDRYYEEVRRYTTAVMFASVYGRHGETFESPEIKAFYNVQNRFSALLEPGGAPPVDGLTFLKYWPEFCAPWKQRAKQIRLDQRSLYFQLMSSVKARMGRGLQTGSFLEELILNQDKSGVDDNHLAYICGNLLEAGSDTTSSQILSFILGLLSNPAVLPKAQAEVDAVCGKDRMPTANDILALPYVNACIREVLRWRPVAAGGVPHFLTRSDTYKGYVLPANTMVLANTWAIHHDANEFEDPDKFWPERWLHNRFGTKHGEERVAEDDREGRKWTYAFGSGRRACPGQKMAENSLFSLISKLIWTFDIQNPEAGLVDTSVMAYTTGFVISPKKFAVSIKPRSEKHKKVAEWECKALPVLSGFPEP